MSVWGPAPTIPSAGIYKRQVLPIEIIAEFGNWRRIRSSDASDGRVHRVLLSPRRTALVSPWRKNYLRVRSRPDDHAALIARLEPRVLVHLEWCDRTWCSVRLPERNLDGYVRQGRLWGVYPDEILGHRPTWLFL
jgi:SH3-like domain-containing protein